MNKKILIIIFILFFVVIFSFFAYKNFNNGNNITNKTTNDIVSNILNMNSYTATVDIKIISNKNENNYILKQKCINGKEYSQEVLKPDNINGVFISNNQNGLKIENSKLNLNKIYKNYPYLQENLLVLDAFINDFNNSDNNTKITENEDEIILETNVKNGNRYNSYKKLFINKKTNKPTKLEIEDETRKALVYILYKEIEINNL